MLNSSSGATAITPAIALVNLTESRDARVLSQIRERALPALREMAGWQYLAHALPAYIVLGRVEECRKSSSGICGAEAIATLSSRALLLQIRNKPRRIVGDDGVDSGAFHLLPFTGLCLESRALPVSQRGGLRPLASC